MDFRCERFGASFPLAQCKGVEINLELSQSVLRADEMNRECAGGRCGRRGSGQQDLSVDVAVETQANVYGSFIWSQTCGIV